MGNSVVSHSTIDRLELVYDEAGRPLQLIFNGRIYNYVLNLQGDVQQIRRATDGVVVATYLYNAWGQLLQSTGSMAESNPLRYRGYFYDVATGLYYLQSRFYDPVIGRFLNWDGLVSTGQGFLGFNMFAYCLNNPVMRIDPSGYVSMSGWQPNMTQAQINRQAAAANAEAIRQLTHMVNHGTDPTRGTPLNIAPGGSWYIELNAQILVLKTQLHGFTGSPRPFIGTSCPVDLRAHQILARQGVIEWGGNQICWITTGDNIFFYPGVVGIAYGGVIAFAPTYAIPGAGKVIFLYDALGFIWTAWRRSGGGG